MNNLSDEQKNYGSLGNDLPSPVFDEDDEKRRNEKLERIQTVLAMKNRDNSSFITSHQTLANISEAVQSPAMWLSTAATIPGLSLAGFSVIMGVSFTFSILNVLVILVVGFFTGLLYWNIIERFRLFATEKASDSYFRVGFSTQKGTKKVYHGWQWYVIMLMMFGLSMVGSGYSVWNIALSTGYQPQSIQDNRQAHFQTYDTQIQAQEKGLSDWTAKKQAEIDDVNNGNKYKWDGKIVPEGKRLITSLNASIQKEKDSRNAKIETLRTEKQGLYVDGKENYEASLKDMMSAAEGNGVFAIIFILLTEFGIFFSVWAMSYYVSGCLEEQQKTSKPQSYSPVARTNPSTPQPIVVIPPTENVLTPQYAIKALHHRMANASSQNNSAEVDACIVRLQEYGRLGYNMDTGEFVGIPQGYVPQSITSSPPPAIETEKNADDLADEDLIWEIITTKKSLSSDNANLSASKNRASAQGAKENAKKLVIHQQDLVNKRQAYLNYLAAAAAERGLKS